MVVAVVVFVCARIVDLFQRYISLVGVLFPRVVLLMFLFLLLRLLLCLFRCNTLGLFELLWHLRQQFVHTMQGYTPVVIVVGVVGAVTFVSTDTHVVHLLLLFIRRPSIPCHISCWHPSTGSHSAQDESKSPHRHSTFSDSMHPFPSFVMSF